MKKSRIFLAFLLLLIVSTSYGWGQKVGGSYYIIGRELHDAYNLFYVLNPLPKNGVFDVVVTFNDPEATMTSLELAEPSSGVQITYLNLKRKEFHFRYNSYSTPCVPSFKPVFEWKNGETFSVIYRFAVGYGPEFDDHYTNYN